MTAISEAKAMGGIGAILVILTVIPQIGWIVGVIGFVLILIATSQISRLVKDRAIFSDMLYSVVLSIVAVIVVGIAVVVAFFRVIGLGTFTGQGFVMNPNVTPGDYLAFFVALVPALVAVWVLVILSAVFLRRSLTAMGNRLNVGLFGTTGLLYFIGALTVIIGIGFLLIFIAEILLAISFFSINEQMVTGGGASPAERVN